MQYKLKEARQKAGMTQIEVAEELNTAQYQIHKWETGKQEPSFARAIELAILYNVSLEYLAGMTEDKNGTWNKPTETKK